MNIPVWHVVSLDSSLVFSGSNSHPSVPVLALRNTCFSLFLGLATVAAAAAENPGTNSNPPKVSYYRDIRPVLQANCQGCHQPAKAKGGYVMTEFKRFVAGGDNEGTAVVPGHTDQSSILKMIRPKDGEVRMPKGKTPLIESEVALISTWIQQGAEDDTPADANRHYDTEHPPEDAGPPVATSLDSW